MTYRPAQKYWDPEPVVSVSKQKWFSGAFSFIISSASFFFRSVCQVIRMRSSLDISNEWLLSADGESIPDTGCSESNMDNCSCPWLRWSETSSVLVTGDCWLLTVDCWLLTVDCWLLTADWWLLTADCWLLTEREPGKDPLGKCFWIQVRQRAVSFSPGQAEPG